METQQKMFLGCLPQETNISLLREYFSQFCLLKEFTLKLRSNKQCAGYGSFICLEPTKVDNLINIPHYHKGRSIECRPYLTKEELKIYQRKFNKRRLYVGKLSSKTTDLQLFSFFMSIAPVVRAYVVGNDELYGGKFGFVVFKNESAIEIFKEMEIYFKGRNLVVKKANRDKNEHIRELELVKKFQKKCFKKNFGERDNPKFVEESPIIDDRKGNANITAIAHNLKQYNSLREILLLSFKISKNHGLGNLRFGRY